MPQIDLWMGAARALPGTRESSIKVANIDL